MALKDRVIDTSNIRYWRQNAELAIRDVYDALVEIITNADDRYMRLKSKLGRIDLEVERKRKGSINIIKVRDFADGMTLDSMEQKLGRTSDHVSGMADGLAVRGTNSRGAKDIAILGGVSFESIAEDGKYHKFEITDQGIPPGQTSKLNDSRKLLKIPGGTGTVVTLNVDPSRVSIPQHESLKSNLSQLVPLRDIFNDPQRKIYLYDINSGRSDLIIPPHIEGHEVLAERLSIPGYKNATAKLIIKRAKTPFDDKRPRFRMGGFLVKSKHAIHEATLFASDLENDPNAQWFYGYLKCEYIDDLWNEFEERFQKGLKPTAENPRGIYDPLRREGLLREHPFVDALYKEALKFFRPLVEQERKRSEHQQAHIESVETKKRLNLLEKAATKFMGENSNLNDDSRSSEDESLDSKFGKKGYGLNPPYTQIVMGHNVKFFLNINQKVFPEFSVGDTIEIDVSGKEIESDKRFGVLELHPTRTDIIRCVWSVKGVKETKAASIKIRIGSIVDESVIEVLRSEKDKYAHINKLSFNHSRYGIPLDSKKTIVLYAPYPSVVKTSTDVHIECSNKVFSHSGDYKLIPNENLGIAICKFRIGTTKADEKATITAKIFDQTASAEIFSLDEKNPTIEIKIEDADYKNQRYVWHGNVLQIAARHPSLRRYLGPPPFEGQEAKHFRVLIAEIVAEAVCARLMSRNEELRPEDFSDSDWDAFYAEYTSLLTKFLPIAHETQVLI